MLDVATEPLLFRLAKPAYCQTYVVECPGARVLEAVETHVLLVPPGFAYFTLGVGQEKQLQQGIASEEWK